MTSSAGKSAQFEIDTVGLIGAGRAGQWFVTKLSRDGYETIVYDVDAEAVADAAERGGKPGENPEDVTRRSDVVVLCLPTQEDVESVMEGENAVLDGLESGQAIVDTGTTPPNVAAHYQAMCDENEAGYVDCGMTRHGPGEGERPSEPAYTMFVGGSEEHYARVRPVIETLSHQHEFFEGIGNGHVVKAAVVLRATCRAALAAEVCEFLANNTIEPDRVVDLLEWDIPEPFIDPPYFTQRGFDRAIHSDERETEKRGFEVNDRGARPRLDQSEWAKDPAYALAVARAANSYVPMLTAAYQTTLLAENYGRALVDRELTFGDDEWHLFHLRSVYRALTCPQEEWGRLAEGTETEE